MSKKYFHFRNYFSLKRMFSIFCQIFFERDIFHGRIFVATPKLNAKGNVSQIIITIFN
jgi:hypothetical protein